MRIVRFITKNFWRVIPLIIAIPAFLLFLAYMLVGHFCLCYIPPEVIFLNQQPIREALHYATLWDPEKEKNRTNGDSTTKVCEYSPLPDDIVSASGETTLSWRVALMAAAERGLEKEAELNKRSCDYIDDTTYALAIHPNDPWYSPVNYQLFKKIPTCYNVGKRYGELENSGYTKLFRIKETHEILTSGAIRIDELNYLPYLVYLEDYSEPWTKPGDISYRDLTSGKYKLKKSRDGWCAVVTIESLHNLSLRAVYQREDLLKYWEDGFAQLLERYNSHGERTEDQ